MRIGAVLLVVWLAIGAVAAGQRHYYIGRANNCVKVGTIALTIVAGPIKYCGVNPKISCRTAAQYLTYRRRPRCYGRAVEWAVEHQQTKQSTVVSKEDRCSEAAVPTGRRAEPTASSSFMSYNGKREVKRRVACRASSSSRSGAMSARRRGTRRREDDELLVARAGGRY
jgi:hypothetical protein